MLLQPRLGLRKAGAACFLVIYVLGLVGTAYYYQFGSSSSSLNDESTSTFVSFIKRQGEPATTNSGRAAAVVAAKNHTTDFEADFMQLRAQHESIWCYRKGTRSKRLVANKANTSQVCACFSDWHGVDCAQPEIVWRALMKSRFIKPTDLRAPTAGMQTKRIYYLLELRFVNVELLNLQLQSLAEVVDWFLIYIKAAKRQDLRKIMRTLEALLPSRNFMCHSCAPHNDVNCNLAGALQYFRSSLDKQAAPLDTDLLLHGDECAIFQPEALTYLKYYARRTPSMRLRLKYNVYGFYWQHPQRTRYAGLIGEFARPLNSSVTLTLGDLNHYAGWYCQFCGFPVQIVQALQSDAEANGSLALRITFPNDTRSHIIDESYVAHLFASGLWLVDGQTQLQPLRLYTASSLYAPVPAMLNKSAYMHLLSNLYDSNDDDDLLQLID